MACLASLLSAEALAAEKPLPRLAGTTLPEGKWALTANVLIGGGSAAANPVDPSGAPVSDGDGVVWGGNFLLPAISVGLSDRWQLGVTTPGIAYRFGERGGTEWVPSLRTGLGFGYSSYQGALLNLFPRAGLDIRSWLGPVSHVTLGGSLGTRILVRGGGSCPPSSTNPEFCEPYDEAFARLVARGQLGFTHTFSGIVTVSIGGHLAYGFSPGDASENAVSFGIGSPIEAGVWYAPPVRWHVAEFFSLDAYGGYLRNTTTGSYLGYGGLGATFSW